MHLRVRYRGAASGTARAQRSSPREILRVAAAGSRRSVPPALRRAARKPKAPDLRRVHREPPPPATKPPETAHRVWLRHWRRPAAKPKLALRRRGAAHPALGPATLLPPPQSGVH